MARDELQKIQIDLLTNPTTSLMLQEKTQLEMLTKLIDAEKSLLRKKLRVPWLQVGDQNTEFFPQSH